MKESLKVLEECAELQKKKGADYQSEKSRIKQADHYPHGVDTIIDMAYQKLIRIYSVLDTIKSNQNLNSEYVDVNFESIEDSAKDAINYLSFAVEYMRGEMDGQNPDNDIFNKPISDDLAELLMKKVLAEQSKTKNEDELKKFNDIFMTALDNERL